MHNRLPDSSTIKNVFNTQDTLRTVVKYIEDNTSYRSFMIATNFPAKEFGDSDLDKTLVDLKLGKFGLFEQYMCETHTICAGLVLKQ